MTDLKLPKDPPVIGKAVTRGSENYGQINYIWVAKISMLAPGLEDDGIEDVFSKYHPTRVFGTLMLSHDETCLLEIGGRPEKHSFYLALPFDCMNENWWGKNPDCEYRKRVKRKPPGGFPPISIRLKEYEKWLARAQPMLVDYLEPSLIPSGSGAGTK